MSKKLIKNNLRLAIHFLRNALALMDVEPTQQLDESQDSTQLLGDLISKAMTTSMEYKPRETTGGKDGRHWTPEKPYKYWSDQEDALLEEAMLKGEVDVVAMAEAFDRSTKAIIGRMTHIRRINNKKKAS